MFVLYMLGLLSISVLITASIKKNDCEVGKTEFRKGYIVLAWLIYIFLVLFRDPVANTPIDLYAYYLHFIEADQPFTQYMATTLFEPVYSVIVWIIRQFTKEFAVALFIFHSVIFAGHIYFFKYVNWNKKRFLCIVGLCLGLFAGLYILRMYLAVSMALVSLVKMYKKKYFKALIFIFIGIGVHNAALILVPMFAFVYLFDKRKSFAKWKLISFALVSLVVTCVLTGLLVLYMHSSDKYHVYSNTGSVPVLLMLALFLVLFFSFRNYAVLFEKSQFNRTLLVALCSNIVVFPLQMQYSIMYRMHLFFVPIEYILLVQLNGVYANRRETLSSVAVRSFTVLYCLYRFFSFFATEFYYIV